MFAENLTTWCRERWEKCPDTFPQLGNSYSTLQKQEREAIFHEYSGKLTALQKESNKNETKPDSAKFFKGLGTILKNVYDFSDEALALILHPDMVGASRNFYQEAKAFDPELQREEIFQALRNAWIMNGLQQMMGKEVRLTPSILGYSLLYPYSDNYLDDPAISGEEKLAFSKRFKQRLMGLGEMGNHYREQRISELVGMIEEEYPRSQFPEVHQSLLAIHAAQTKSIRLSCKGKTQLLDDEVLSISFEKGGASVLADGYLVAGHLSPEMQRFLFGYGVWLQLADDIQDLEEDLQSDTMTIFSGFGTPEECSLNVNRTFHFGSQIMESIKYCSENVCDHFSKVILHSINIMVIQSAGLQGKYFPATYLKELELFSPVGFRFLREAKKKGTPGRFRLLSQMVSDPV